MEMRCQTKRAWAAGSPESSLHLDPPSHPPKQLWQRHDQSPSQNRTKTTPKTQGVRRTLLTEHRRSSHLKDSSRQPVKDKYQFSTGRTFTEKMLTASIWGVGVCCMQAVAALFRSSLSHSCSLSLPPQLHLQHSTKLMTSSVIALLKIQNEIN